MKERAPGRWPTVPLTLVLLLSAAPARAEVGAVPPLASLGPAELATRLKGDVTSLHIYRAGIQRTLAAVRARPDLFPPASRKGTLTLGRDQREAAVRLWQQLLDYLLALDSLGSYHRRFYKLGRPARGESFLIAYGAFVAQYRHALEFIQLAENEPVLAKLLDEQVVELGLPAGWYRHVKDRFLDVGRATELLALAAVHQVYGGSDYPAARQAIADDVAFLFQMGKGRGEKLSLKHGLAVIQRLGKSAWFPVQAGVAEWMGDTKVWRRTTSLISPAQIEAARARLQPGDILLERREWYLSNIGLPGFWSHAALYVGTARERRAFFSDPSVREWVRSQGRPDGDFEGLLQTRFPRAYALAVAPQAGGHLPRVIEAISEGVSFTTLEHSAAADSLAVLRPKLGKAQKALALSRAFQYSGRPYDFDFDFATDSTLVCTELIYKAYEAGGGATGLRFQLTKTLGRPVVPANGIARQLDEEHGSPKQQLDLVLFLDGFERQKAAVEASLADFRRSWRRPKWHVLVQGSAPKK